MLYMFGLFYFMASAKFSIGQVSITGSLRIVAREVLFPLAEVYNQLYPAPHPTVRNIVIDGLNPVMHYFDFYETSDPLVQGTLLSSFTIDVGLLNVVAFDFIEFKVDGEEVNDPAAGSTTYNNTSIAGKEYMVSQRGIGTRSFEDELLLLPAGGFQLLNGETFISQDRWFLTVANTVTVSGGGGGGGGTSPGRGLFTDIIEVTADRTITNDDYNKQFEITGAGVIRTLTFPLLGTIPEDTIFGINTHYTTVRYTAVQLQSGESIRFCGSERNVLWLGKNETLIFEKKNGFFKVLSYEGDYKRLGEKVKSDIAPVNSLPETGSWYEFVEYPRFYYDYVSKIPPAQLALASDVTNNLNNARLRFSINTITQMFWMPDTGGYFERNVDPDGNVDVDRILKFTGSFQGANVGKHRHDYIDAHGEGYTGGPVVEVSGSGQNNQINYPKEAEDTGDGIGVNSDNRPLNVASLLS